MEEIICECGAKFYYSVIASKFHCPRCNKKMMSEEEYINTLLKSKLKNKELLP